LDESGFIQVDQCGRKLCAAAVLPFWPLTAKLTPMSSVVFFKAVNVGGH
jgi:hypothetical protein